jgi:hypothetical protein
MPYKNLMYTLQMMGKQVAESVQFADQFLPRATTPKEIWFILKDNLVYKNDPPGIELLQSFPSLMNDNYWGIPGAGDCDCFTIAALACAAARRYSSSRSNCGQQLAGSYSRLLPVFG